MPRRPPQPRNAQGRFVTQPQQEEADTITEQPQSDPSRLNPVQRILLAINRPLITDTPVSELVVNIAQAAYYGAPDHNSPDTPRSLPFASGSIPSPPARYVSPPRYTTDPPISVPDFNVPGSDDTIPPLPPLPPSSEPEDINMSQRRAFYSDDELSYIDDEDFAPPPPPVPPCPLHTPQPRRGRRRCQL